MNKPCTWCKFYKDKANSDGSEMPKPYCNYFSEKLSETRLIAGCALFQDQSVVSDE